VLKQICDSSESKVQAQAWKTYRDFITTRRRRKPSPPMKMTVTQWRRQDLLRGEEGKGHIRLWSTHGGLQGRVQQRLDD